MTSRRVRSTRTARRPADAPSVYLTAQDVARLLRLHVKRVQVLARAGRLPTIRVGRKWLFPRAQLLEALHGTPAVPSDDGVAISARNRLRGRITSISVDGVMAEVRIGVGDQELVSIITRASAEHMRLRAGDPVIAVIKATEVMVGKALGPRAR